MNDYKIEKPTGSISLIYRKINRHKQSKTARMHSITFSSKTKANQSKTEEKKRKQNKQKRTYNK